jgi:hypothetical protein
LADAFSLAGFPTGALLPDAIGAGVLTYLLRTHRYNADHFFQLSPKLTRMTIQPK